MNEWRIEKNKERKLFTEIRKKKRILSLSTVIRHENVKWHKVSAMKEIKKEYINGTNNTKKEEKKPTKNKIVTNELEGHFYLFYFS